MTSTVSIQTHDFELSAEVAALHAQDGGVGAVVSFVGIVRSSSDGSAVSAMELEHYPGMTERAIDGMVGAAHQRFDIRAARVVHRVGLLPAGAQIVLVAVASAHRGQAFQACEFLMDYLKTQAPFWKKETTPQGARWVDVRVADDAALARWGRSMTPLESGGTADQATSFDADAVGIEAAPELPPAAIDPQTLRTALGRFATGVTIVSCLDADGGFVGLTVNSFASLSLHPPLVLWSLRESSPSVVAFAQASHFVVNVLAESQADVSRRFAMRAADKFDVGVWSAGAHGAPVLAGCSAVFQCESVSCKQAGDHRLFIGRVLAFDDAALPPLLYQGGHYRRLGEPL